MTTRKLLAGQRALVTGASSGIGAAVAQAVAEAGAKVAVNYSASKEQAQRVADEIRDGGGEAIAIRADVSKEDQVLAMFRRVFGEWGSIDILVNNAGPQRDAKFVDMTLADWNFVLAINLTGQFLRAREAAREFIRRGVVPELSRAAGKIICISSVHEVIPWLPRELRGIERRRRDDDEEHGAGARGLQDSDQLGRARRNQNADQSRCVGNAGGRGEAAESHPLRTRWRSRANLVFRRYRQDIPAFWRERAAFEEQAA
jgi:NAD(P)-dependent dehydrogenase (short-subunit alcohol dehydrogenase family)